MRHPWARTDIRIGLVDQRTGRRGRVYFCLQLLRVPSQRPHPVIGGTPDLRGQ